MWWGGEVEGPGEGGRGRGKAQREGQQVYRLHMAGASGGQEPALLFKQLNYTNMK